MQIGAVERVRLGIFPTPLVELNALSDHLGGPRIFMKRDDLDGLGMGGNKLRKLEYTMADAIAQRATTVITTGAVQSNHCRLTAAAANKLGMKCHLVLSGEEPQIATGNLLLDKILGLLHSKWVSLATRGAWIRQLRARGSRADAQPQPCPRLLSFGMRLREYADWPHAGKRALLPGTGASDRDQRLARQGLHNQEAHVIPC